MTASARLQRLVWPVGLFVIVAALADLVLFGLNAAASGGAVLGTRSPGLRTQLPVLAIAFALIGALIVSRLPANLVGWIFWASGIAWAIQSLMTEHSWTAARVGPLPGATESGWLAALLHRPSFLLTFTFILLVFPDGHLPSRRWAPVAIAAGVLIALGGVIQLIAWAPAYLHSALPPDNAHLPYVAVPVGLPAVLAGVVGLIVKYRRADGDRRQQLKWLVFGAAVIVFSLLFQPVPAILILVPISLAIAILRYRLYDIDLVINRTLVYGALAVTITLVYVAIVVGVGSLIGRGSQANFILSIAATALVAVAFQPLRARAQRLANRLVYGERATPYEVLSRFSERISETVPSDETLSQMARVLAQGTGATRAEVWLRMASSLQCAAEYPALDKRPEPLPLHADGSLQIAGVDALVPVEHKGELLGALAVRKRKGESLTPIETKLLADLARQAGLVLKNVGLAADLRQWIEELRASRERLVAAQDAERRRLERNIHDGAQQNLVALKVKLGLARHAWQKQPHRLGALLDELSADADESLNTLRVLARGVFPPLLAERGLATALEAQARRSPFPVELNTTGLGRYRADLEAAVYFCCVEAMQNAAKYSGANRMQIQLSQQNGNVVFAIKDDGRGYDMARVKPGSGLQNMIDRVEALGGLLEIASAVGSGTLVKGHIPVVGRSLV